MEQNKLFVLKVLLLTFLFSFIFSIPIFVVDPFFVYHKPLKNFKYELFNQRSQNRGIVKHFDYDAIITGTSMTENFKASEAEKFFNLNFVKVSFSGASFKEINDNLKVAFKHNKNIKIVIRSLDAFCFGDDKNQMNWEADNFPTYLYNKNPFDDVKYIFNAKIFNLSLKTLFNQNQITDFDRYSYWMHGRTFGKNAVLKGRNEFKQNVVQNATLNQSDKQRLIENLEQNVISIAKENPNCDFYCFFIPQSAIWWGGIYNGCGILRQVELEKTIIEELLKCENIKLFSFNNEFEIIKDLNNYKDEGHYGEWINTLMLKKMSKGENIITKENYLSYLEQITNFYSNFDYNSLFTQEDFPDRKPELEF